MIKQGFAPRPNLQVNDMAYDLLPWGLEVTAKCIRGYSPEKNAREAIVKRYGNDAVKNYQALMDAVGRKCEDDLARKILVIGFLQKKLRGQYIQPK